MSIMKICCISCDENYIEDDADIISYMEKTNDFMGWCDKCIRENLEDLKENNKIIHIVSIAEG